MYVVCVCTGVMLGVQGLVYFLCTALMLGVVLIDVYCLFTRDAGCSVID